MPQRHNGSLPDRRRDLPGIDALLRSPELAEIIREVPRADLISAIRMTLNQARMTIADGEEPPDLVNLALQIQARVETMTAPIPRPVINATGVIINTNLGRAPLSTATLDAMRAVAGGYSALEYDLDAGARGSRNSHAREALCAITGAEDVVVVNNTAAALVLILSALLPTDRREVIISRGQLIEIGGGFRIPDVLRQSGARLVEVGTTNRTRIADYAAAITPATGMILAVHPSNFRVIGFTEAPTLAELATLAHTHDLPLIEDQGSGCLIDLSPFGLTPEPTPQASLVAGADIICFSGDKLLGGPQAGIILGHASFIAMIARHPLMRALRVDKVTMAGLVATLRHYQRGEALSEIPIWRMIALPEADLRGRAEGVVAALIERGVTATTQLGESTIGGGSLPGETLITWHVALLASDHGDLDALARRLRLGSPAIVPRVSRDALLLDPRTIFPEQDRDVVEALAIAIQTR